MAYLALLWKTSCFTLFLLERAIKDTFLIISLLQETDMVFLPENTTMEDHSCKQSFLLQWEESPYYKYAMKEKEAS